MTKLDVSPESEWMKLRKSEATKQSKLTKTINQSHQKYVLNVELLCHPLFVQKSSFTIEQMLF